MSCDVGRDVLGSEKLDGRELRAYFSRSLTPGGATIRNARTPCPNVQEDQVFPEAICLRAKTSAAPTLWASIGLKCLSCYLGSSRAATEGDTFAACLLILLFLLLFSCCCCC